MVPVSSIIIFFQVGAVNNGRNWASIGIMGSEWGMDFLLSKMSFVQLLSYPKRGFMPYSFPQIVQSRALMLANELHNMLNRQPSLREHAVLGHHGVSRKEKGKGMPHARPDLQFDLNPGT